jgi:vitamin B12 transporter
MSVFRSRVLVAPLLLTPALALADSAPAALQEVTISATKLGITQAQMTQPAEVVSAVDISAQAQTSVTEVLRQQPGIQLAVAGAPGQSLSVRLRGFADSTLYVFDGITMNAGGSGDVGYLLGQLDPSMVQSIEVLRGPHATTYGANSTSGVIELTTLEGDHPEANLSVEAGSLERRKIRLGLQDEQALGAGSLSASLNGSYIHTGGVNAFEYTRNGTIVARATFRTDRLAAGGSFYLTDNRFQSASLIESVQDAPAPYFAVQLPNPANVDSTKAGIVSLWLEQQLSARLSQKLTLGGAGQDFRLADGQLGNGGLVGTYVSPYDGWVDPNTFSAYAAGEPIQVYQTPNTYRTVNNNGEAEYNLRYRDGSISAMLGATYLGQNFDVSSNYGGFATGSRQHQATRSVYGDASADWLHRTLHTSVGARYDSYTAWKNKTTYSVGAAYDLVPQLTVYANYGTSFTQPTLSQLYDPTYGNTNITPENAHTAEAGLRGRQLEGTLTETLTFWHSDVNNVVTFDFTLYNPRILNGSPFGKYNNAAAQRSQGIEVELAYRIAPHLTFNGNYTYTDAHITDSAGIWQLMVQNARNMGNAGVTYAARRLDVGTNVYVTGRRLRWAGDFWAPGYARADLFARFHASSDFDLYARVQNLLDRHITEVLGYRSPGVYVVAGGTLRLH